MNNKSLSVLPLVVFMLLLAGVGYFMFWERLVITPTPPPTEEVIPPTEISVVTFTSTATSLSTTFTPTRLPSPTPPPVPPTPTGTFTPSPTDTPTVTPTNTPTPTPTATNTPTVTSAPTLSPTLTATSVSTPTPPPGAVVIATSGSDLYSGPGIIYQKIGMLGNGETLNIQGQVGDGRWVEINSITTKAVGWVQVDSSIQLKVDLSTIPAVEPPIPPTLLSPPTLISPGNNESQYKNRASLSWEWPGFLGSNDYFRVELWNRYNVCCPYQDGDEFANNVIPIDVGWVKNKFYIYDEIELDYDREFKWRVTVVRGKPTIQKQWSTLQNEVWDPPSDYKQISDPSEMRTLFVEETGDTPPPRTSDRGSDGIHNDPDRPPN